MSAEDFLDIPTPKNAVGTATELAYIEPVPVPTSVSVSVTTLPKYDPWSLMRLPEFWKGAKSSRLEGKSLSCTEIVEIRDRGSEGRGHRATFVEGTQRTVYVPTSDQVRINDEMLQAIESMEQDCTHDEPLTNLSFFGRWLSYDRR